MRLSEPISVTHTLRFSCFGVRIAVEFDSRIPPSNIQPVLPPEFSELQGEKADHYFSFVRTPETGRGENMYLIGEGSTRSGSPDFFGPALLALRKKIHRRIAEYARDRVFVHAGVVAWKGRAIICPGRSFAGKSTLVWSMLNSGAAYYSDEYAVFDNNGLAHPFPVPICLRQAPEWNQSVVSNSVGTKPLSPSLVLFAQYRPNGHWEPGVLTPGQAVLGLLQNSISMRRNPRAVLEALKRVALASKAYAGERGEANTVIDWLKGIAM